MNILRETTETGWHYISVERDNTGKIINLSQEMIGSMSSANEEKGFKFTFYDRSLCKKRTIEIKAPKECDITRLPFGKLTFKTFTTTKNGNTKQELLWRAR